jgi:hydrogenase expression/formation protein HypE
MALRNNLSFSHALVSDCAHLNHLIREVTERYPESIRFMRDATRGGAASVLNEAVKGLSFSAKILESSIPVRDEVLGICGLLGLDPLYIANEGKVIMIVKRDDAAGILKILNGNRLGAGARIIGEIDAEFPGKVYMETRIGGRRILPLQVEEQLPRIC